MPANVDATLRRFLSLYQDATTPEGKALAFRALLFTACGGGANVLFTGNGYTATGNDGLFAPLGTEVRSSPGTPRTHHHLHRATPTRSRTAHHSLTTHHAAPTRPPTHPAQLAVGAFDLPPSDDGANLARMFICPDQLVPPFTANGNCGA